MAEIKTGKLLTTRLQDAEELDKTRRILYNLHPCEITKRDWNRAHNRLLKLQFEYEKATR